MGYIDSNVPRYQQGKLSCVASPYANYTVQLNGDFSVIDFSRCLNASGLDKGELIRRYPRIVFVVFVYVP